MNEKCPYSVGDKVRFTPSERTKGLYQDIERFGLELNQVATIREIRHGIYLYFDDERGGLPWNEFSPVRKGEDG